MLRFSSSNEFPGYFGTFGPAFAVKFLLDGLPSANAFGIHYVHATRFGNFDVKSANYSNRGLRQETIEGPELGLFPAFIAKFGQASTCPNILGLHPLGTVGPPKSKVQLPFELIFEPTLFEGLEFPRGGFSPEVFVDFKQKIPVNQVLFRLYARQYRDSTETIFVGDIVTRSRFVPSQFGDRQLFFRHPTFENDLEFHPEWRETLNLTKDCQSFYSDLSEMAPRFDPTLDPFDLSAKLTCPFARTASPSVAVTSKPPTRKPTPSPSVKGGKKKSYSKGSIKDSRAKKSKDTKSRDRYADSPKKKVRICLYQDLYT